MDKETLSRATTLSKFIDSYTVAINRYWKNIDCRTTSLGNALADIDKLCPNGSKDIKAAMKKALDCIVKEFDNL